MKMSKFSRTLLGKNIKFLATQKGIKLGDLEGQVEVSTGYFSRLLNEDSKNSSTLMDTICKVAEKLGTSVNTLISTDLSALTPNERLLSNFFDKLEKDTSESVLIWDLETKNQLDNPAYQSNHPLFANNDPYGNGFDLYYRSLFDTDATIAGDGYRVIVNNKLLYLIKTSYPQNEHTGFEVYFYSNFRGNIVEKICKAYPESDLFYQLEDLYNAAAESSRHVKLSESVLGTIDGYMNPKPDDIPF